MFNKFINFQVRKPYLTYILDELSEFAEDGIHVSDANYCTYSVYEVWLYCNRKNFDTCLKSIMELHKTGINIKHLRTL